MRNTLTTAAASVLLSACAATPLMRDAEAERSRNITAAEIAYSYLKYPRGFVRENSAFKWTKEDKQFVLESNVAACIHNTHVYNLDSKKLKDRGGRAQTLDVDYCYPDDSKRNYFKR